MANALGIDLGNVYRTTEAIRNSRDARSANKGNAANALATAEAQQQAATGSPGAMTALIGQDPARALQVQSAISAMTKQQREAKQRELQKLGTILLTVRDSKDPAGTYANLRNQLPPDLQNQIPDKYDPTWIDYNLARATQFSDQLSASNKQQDAVTTRQNQLTDATTTRQNRLTDATTAQQRAIALENLKSQNTMARTVAKAAADGGGGVDTATSNAIFKQVGTFFGGFYDPATGKFSGLDRVASAKVQELSALAEQIAVKDKLPVAQAVEKAAEQLGIKVQGTIVGARNAANAPNPLNLINPGPPPDSLNTGK